jgi:hypothetical protein
MAVSKTGVLYNGIDDKAMLVTQLKSYGTSLKNGWINYIGGIKTSYNFPKSTVAGDVLKGYDCALNSTSTIDYTELKLSVQKFMMNFTECNDVFEGTQYEQLYQSGGLAKIPQEALTDLIVEPLLAKAGKEYGEAVWQAVDGGVYNNTIPLIDLFDGLEKSISDNSANIQVSQAPITKANVLTELDAFITYTSGITNSEDWFYPAYDLTNENFPAIWVDKATWNVLNQVAYDPEFSQQFNLGETPEPFKGQYRGYTIYADSLTAGTFIAGKKDNLHVGADARIDVEGAGASLEVNEVANTNQFKISYVDRIGTKVTLANQVSLRRVAA